VAFIPGKGSDLIGEDVPAARLYIYPYDDRVLGALLGVPTSALLKLEQRLHQSPYLGHEEGQDQSHPQRQET
jgi:hypothetical protein